ncbi:hypothetical protein ECNE037_1707, partial [Escherichia coli NE037]
MVHRSAWFQG